MRSLSRDESLDLWDNWWDETSSEFFKVEALQDYTAEELKDSKSYQAWYKGDKVKALSLLRDASSAQSITEPPAKSPIKIVRVHIVVEPYSSYLEWEIEHYKLVNIPIEKEEVYLISADKVNKIYAGDFMIFDKKRVADSRYDASGLLSGMDFYEYDNIGKFLEARGFLLAHAEKIIV
jgi:hypothetical protein